MGKAKALNEALENIICKRIFSGFHLKEAFLIKLY
jgi:hypothetical protein